MFAVVTKIDFNMALTSFGIKNSPKAYLLRAFLSSSRYFEIRPFILFVQAHPESTTGFFSSEKIEEIANFLIVSGTFFSLGHLSHHHHVLASVLSSKRHFLEIEEGIH